MKALLLVITRVEKMSENELSWQWGSPTHSTVKRETPLLTADGAKKGLSFFVRLLWGK